jgi:tRNA 2-thiouridine synthesizing protein E
MKVSRDNDGFMLNKEEWTREIAVEIASEDGLSELTENHWKVIEYLQETYDKTGALPTIRAIKKSGVVSIKEFYDLFPGAPLKLASKISGLSKPSSCV